MKNLTKFIAIILVLFLTIACEKNECAPTEKIVTVHDTTIVTINNEPTYLTTGEWRYYTREYSIDGVSGVEFAEQKWKFTAYRAFVDVNNDGVYEKEGFFGNFGTYIIIYFYGETEPRRYDIIMSTTQILYIGRTVGNMQEKLYMQKWQ